MRKRSKPSNQEFKKIFDRIAPKYNSVSNSYLVLKRKEVIASWAQGQCLEVGAGSGEISKYLAGKNHRVIATDISSAMVEEIKKLGITAFECDAEKLNFPNNTFDSIIAAEVIFYLDNPDLFFSKAYKILKPKGRLIISCSSNFPVKFYDRFRSFLRFLGFNRGMYFEDTLREFMTLSKLKKLLARNSFTVLEVKKTPVVPIGAFDKFNNFLDKTPLKYFGIFILVCAEKE